MGGATDNIESLKQQIAEERLALQGYEAQQKRYAELCLETAKRLETLRAIVALECENKLPRDLER